MAEVVSRGFGQCGGSAFVLCRMYCMYSTLLVLTSGWETYAVPCRHIVRFLAGSLVLRYESPHDRSFHSTSFDLTFVYCLGLVPRAVELPFSLPASERLLAVFSVPPLFSIPFDWTGVPDQPIYIGAYTFLSYKAGSDLLPRRCSAGSG